MSFCPQHHLYLFHLLPLELVSRVPLLVRHLVPLFTQGNMSINIKYLRITLCLKNKDLIVRSKLTRLYKKLNQLK